MAGFYSRQFYEPVLWQRAWWRQRQTNARSLRVKSFEFRYHIVAPSNTNASR